MKINWKVAGVLGILVYFLSLPIMIWRSSKLGKVISTVLFAVVLLWVLGKGSDLIVNKLYYPFILQEGIKVPKQSLEIIKNDIWVLKTRTTDLDKQANELVEQLTTRANQSIQQKKDSILESLSLLEKDIDIIREEERQALKEKIIMLKEKVIKEKLSITSSEIRLECEKVNDKLSLLNNDEKDRFYKDLADMGFYVEKINKTIDNYSQRINFVRRDGNWGTMTSDSLYVGTMLSSDAISYYHDN